MNNVQAYEKLISEAAKYYVSRPLELRNIQNGKDVYDFVWCNGLNDEINLWTYWQGAGIEKPEVIIVGQDFGTCYDDENKAFYERCVNCGVENREIISREYIRRIQKNKNNKTDNSLITLTEKGLGEQYSAAIPCNDRLFMTNLCLGYRTAGSISGGNITAYLKHDSLYIARLIKIKRPKAVICLGLNTYASLVSAFEDEQSVFIDIIENFWGQLDSGKNYRDINSDGISFRIYGVSHAGSNGAMNRKSNCSIIEKSDLTGMNLMLYDWKEIGKYLSEMC